MTAVRIALIVLTLCWGLSTGALVARVKALECQGPLRLEPMCDAYWQALADPGPHGYDDD